MNASATVKLAGSGKTFTARAGETILAAALRQGIVLPYSCRNGTCASCHATLVHGVVEYPYQPPAALDAGEIGRGQVLLCQAVASGDVVIEAREIEAVRDIPIRILPARVSEKHLLSPSVVQLRLTLPKGMRMQFLAGQYIDILTGDGLAGKGRRRAFSLASPPHQEAFLELHIRYVDGGDFTEYVFHRLAERDILRFQGPLGTFFIRDDSRRPILMLGGGTGFAPLKAMVEHLLHCGSTRPIHLYWGARNRAELYLDALPRRWAAENAFFKYTPVLSDPEPDERWTGRSGWVHEALLADYPDPAGYDIYMSGPPAMIDVARHRFQTAGHPEDRLFYDSFDFSADTPAGGGKAAAGGTAGSNGGSPRS